MNKKIDSVIKPISKEVTMNSVFFKDEIGLWKGQLYVSMQDANIWNPQTSPNSWEKYTEYIFAI